jgi:hypothetical protein
VPWPKAYPASPLGTVANASQRAVAVLCVATRPERTSIINVHISNEGSNNTIVGDNNVIINNNFTINA